MSEKGDTTKEDGWESGPNPVRQIIVTRTAQVGGAAGLALAGLGTVLPASQTIPLAIGGGVGVTLGLSAYFVATFYARTPFGGSLWVRLPRQAGNVVALTFDDGPHPNTTPRLLDLLAQANVQATFFLVGERARAYPDLARRVAEAGHTIGVHGLRHRTMVLQNARQIACDLREAARILEDTTGKPLAARLLRPPYGFKTWTLGRVARREGWTIASWSLDGRDYDPQTPAQLAERISARLAVRDIVLLHERPGDSVTLDALPAILTDCQTRAFACVGLAAVAGAAIMPESLS